MAREVKMPYDFVTGEPIYLEKLKAFEALVRADERMRFYGQDKPAECADGCPPNQICDYCQVVAPVKAMILAEREACAKVCDDLLVPVHISLDNESLWEAATLDCADAIRNRGNT
jgi:hypothetical protein